MSDLIERQAAITIPVTPKEDREYQTYNLDDAYELGWEDLQNRIEQLPTVEAVPVVRCKDCKWWKINYSWDKNKRRICVIEAYEPLRKAEDFCSRGERREDE